MRKLKKSKRETNLKRLQINLTLRKYFMDESAEDNPRLQEEIQIFHLRLFGGFG